MCVIQNTNVCLYSGLARARVHVLSYVCFFWHGVAFNITEEVIIRLLPEPGGFSESRGGATWRCTMTHARAHGLVRHMSVARLCGKLSQYFSMPLGTAVCPTRCYLAKVECLAIRK